ncbi:MAG: CinA family protein [Treponema sp.]|jgi:PncC family amidohydrolase|nr:CinA family protein [Treponema sp.]
MEGPDERSALLVEKLAAASLMVAAAESCSAGLVADRIARVPGASQVFWGSFVSYMADAKTLMLGLDREKLGAYGPVSRETACSMAEAALEKSGAGIAVAVTGLAGPGGDGTAVPVGTVWIATALRGGETLAEVFHFKDSRNNIRNRAAASAVEALLKRL